MASQLRITKQSQVLRRGEGWVPSGRLELGDEVLVSEHEYLRWGVVLDDGVCHIAQLVALSNQRRNKFAATVVDDQRWFTDRRRHLGDGSRPLVREVTATHKLTTEHRLLLAAPGRVPDRVGPETVAYELPLWAFTDGTLKLSPLTGATSQAGGSRRQVILRIVQSKPEGRRAIEAMLAELGIGHAADPPRAPRTSWLYRVSSPEARALLAALGYTGQPEDEWVHELGSRQLREVLKVMHLAEGTLGAPRYVLTQNSGPVLEAMRFALLMDGWVPSESANNSDYEYRTPMPSQGRPESRRLRGCDPHVTMQRVNCEPCGFGVVVPTIVDAPGLVVRQEDCVFRLAGHPTEGREDHDATTART